jgi:hypothetical protein
VEIRPALETLLRQNWGTTNPGFSAMFTRMFIPENASPENQKWFDALQPVSASPDNAPA